MTLPRLHLHISKRVATRWFFVIVILYLELTLKVSVGDDVLSSLLFIALFSLCAGRFLSLAITLPVNPKVNQVVTGILTGALGVIYTVMYFVRIVFKSYYEPSTILSGASGVVGDFSGTVIGLVLCPSGIFHILLFLLPLVAFVVALRRVPFGSYHETARGRIRVAFTSVEALFLTLLLITFVPAASNLYWSQYNFNTGVKSFGLLDSTRRALGTMVFGDTVAFGDQSTGGTDGSDAPTYDSESYNVMNIDFDEISSDTEDETLARMDAYVQSLTPSSKNEMTGRFEGKNLIFITAESLSAEAIREDVTPTLYRMATKGMVFSDFYQPESASTTGGECNNLLGLLPMKGGTSLSSTCSHNNYFTIGNALSREGYKGWAFHDHLYTYYSRDESHVNLGYSEGYMGMGNGMEEFVEDQWTESDLEMAEGTLDMYADQQPFNVYYMSVSAHGPYSYDGQAMCARNWDVVEDLDCSYEVKGYLAANVELDRAIQYLIDGLDERGILDDTVFVVVPDHYPYTVDGEGTGYESSLNEKPMLTELYGFEPTDLFGRDHSRLIIWNSELEDEDPIEVTTPVCSIDVLPTLLNLFGCDWDSRMLPGRDVFSDADPLVFFTTYDWKTDLGTYLAETSTFEANEGAEVPDGYVDKINAVVADKISYCLGVLDYDYYGHVFGPSATAVEHVDDGDDDGTGDYAMGDEDDSGEESDDADYAEDEWYEGDWYEEY